MPFSLLYLADLPLEEQVPLILRHLDIKPADSQHDMQTVEALRRQTGQRRWGRDPDGMTDGFDYDLNGTVFVASVGQVPVATARIHAVSPSASVSPSEREFPGIALDALAHGTFVDFSGLAIDGKALAQAPALPYAMLRLAVMACEFHEAGLCVSVVGSAERDWFARGLMMSRLDHPAETSSGRMPMAIDFRRQRASLYEQFPFYRSSEPELARIIASL